MEKAKYVNTLKNYPKWGIKIKKHHKPITEEHKYELIHVLGLGPRVGRAFSGSFERGRMWGLLSVKGWPFKSGFNYYSITSQGSLLLWWSTFEFLWLVWGVFRQVIPILMQECKQAKLVSKVGTHTFSNIIILLCE